MFLIKCFVRTCGKGEALSRTGEKEINAQKVRQVEAVQGWSAESLTYHPGRKVSK